MILSQFGVTAELTAGRDAGGRRLRIPLGILSARREKPAPGSRRARASLFSLSIPVFWQATMMILAASLWFNWAPGSGFVSLWTIPKPTWPSWRSPASRWGPPSPPCSCE